MSANEGELRDAQKVVRNFSLKAYAEDPDDDLAKSLIIAEVDAETEKSEETLKKQWMQMFERNDVQALK